MQLMGKLPRKAVAAGLAAAVSVGLAVGQTSAAAPIDAPAPAPPSSGVITQASSDQVSAFSVLGSPRTAEDDVNVASVSALEAGLRDIAHANLRLAHRIGAPDAAERAWLIPGDGQLCTVTDRSDTGLYTYGCVPTAVAAAGDALQTRSGGPQLKDDMAIVDLLVPDGVHSVTIGSSEPSTETDVVVIRNWLQKTLKNPTSISFDRGGVRHANPFGQLPTE